MSRVSESDARQLAGCYKVLAPAVFSYAMLLTRGERALAEDLVQDTFKAAARRWAKIRDLDDEQRFIRLKAITRNKAIDIYRRQCTAQARQAELVARRQDDSGTHELAMMRISCASLDDALARLPRRQYLVAVMRFRDQMTIAAIAAELRVSTGTVSGDIKKIRKS